MPRLVSSKLVACALAFVLSLSLAATAAAKGVSASLRVVGKGGKVLTQQTLRTGTTSLETSPRANCFGTGTGGSGKSVRLKGPTALGMLGQAAKSTGALRPLLITDAFDFGLGICGVGGSVAGKSASWYLKVNHENPELGGEMVKVRPGDEVLWALAGFPYPQELSLAAPFSAHPGQPFQVSVYSYDDKGRRRPAAGATVTGASGPTDASGKAMVVLSGATTLVARRGKDIPSNSQSIHMCQPDGACPIP
jgi:hypothetical protein